MVNWREACKNCLGVFLCLGRVENKGKNREEIELTNNKENQYQSEEELVKDIINAQEWLDKNYPKEGCYKYGHVSKYGEKVKRSEVQEIYLNEPTLARELDLEDFTFFFGVDIYISSQLDETKLVFKNKSERVRIIKLAEVQRWLDFYYPKNGNCIRKDEGKEYFWQEGIDNFDKTRKEIIELDISGESLEGHLNLDDFPNLKGLVCWKNKLTSLDCSNCEQLEKIICSRNLLTNINLPTNPTNLKILDLRHNNFPNQDLINENNKHEKYGFCLKCRQLNTSKNWCQPCREKEWKQLSGQKLIETFIQNQPKREHGAKLQWIPYEQLTNIEQISEGGFSKIYKAKWGKYENGDVDRIVILKSFINSQNITLEFLNEITNIELIGFGNRVVPCYGISQDPISKNCAMVMEYMNKGNLRQWLQNKNSELSLKDKLWKLWGIAIGLSSIHHQNLIHRDFHSGNILNNDYRSFVSDLGLSCPTNYQKEEGQIFGVLPYVAPEVLQGKPYTQASDIYSFGIITYELFANTYPYPEMDNLDLILGICNKDKPLRPNINKVPIPQKLKDLVKKCLDTIPKKRPTSWELEETIHNFWKNWVWIGGREIEQEYNQFSQNTPYQIHPKAITTSKMIDTKQITQQLEKLRIAEEYQHSANLELDINNFNLDEINLQEEDNNQSENWNNISASFNEELIQQWKSNNFTYPQTQDWINTGLKPTDYNFCAWLRDTKQLTLEQALNHHNLEILNQAFFKQNQLQAQIQQPPK